MNTLLDSCNSIEEVVLLINDEIGNDACPERLAAQYAYESAVESGYEVDEFNIEAQLDALVDDGAGFDYQTAKAFAINMIED